MKRSLLSRLLRSKRFLVLNKMFLWVERFERVEFINDHVQVTIVTRANEFLTMQMDWATFDAACDMFARLKPN